MPALSAPVLDAALALVDEKLPSTLALRTFVGLVRAAFYVWPMDRSGRVRFSGGVDGLRRFLFAKAKCEHDALTDILDLFANAPVLLPDGRVATFISKWRVERKGRTAELIIEVGTALTPAFVREVEGNQEARRLVPLELPLPILGTRSRYAETRVALLYLKKTREQAEMLYNENIWPVTDVEYRSICTAAGLDCDGTERLMAAGGHQFSDEVWRFIHEAGRKSAAGRARMLKLKKKRNHEENELLDG
jgi:hypothetical protein